MNVFFQGTFRLTLQGTDLPTLQRSDQRDVLLQSYKNFVALLAELASEEDLDTLQEHFLTFADKQREKLEKERPYMPWW